MSSSPSIPTPVTPAIKPERQIDVAPEDIQLGSSESEDLNSGRNKLKRPRSSVGTGIAI